MRFRGERIVARISKETPIEPFARFKLSALLPDALASSAQVGFTEAYVRKRFGVGQILILRKNKEIKPSRAVRR